jgi:hypothetical protein
MQRAHVTYEFQLGNEFQLKSRYGTLLLASPITGTVRPRRESIHAREARFPIHHLVHQLTGQPPLGSWPLTAVCRVHTISLNTRDYGTHNAIASEPHDRDALNGRLAASRHGMQLNSSQDCYTCGSPLSEFSDSPSKRL